MIIIASSWSRDQSMDQRPQVGLLDYLLIRLITVFDPAFAGSFFARFSGLWLQANEVFGCCKFDGADNIKRISLGKQSPARLEQTNGN